MNTLVQIITGAMRRLRNISLLNTDSVGAK